jgi:hypothetical protein
LLTHGIESPVPVRDVLNALHRQAVAASRDYPLNHLEALYLHQRLARAAGIRTSQPVDTVPIAFSWQSQWQSSSYRAIYELVHAVYFLTDFGHNCWHSGIDVLAPHAMALSSAIDQACSLCLRHRHLDLIGELALARLYLDSTADVRPLLETLLSAQLPSGAIPGWRSGHDIAGHYHSTLVAMMAFSVALKRGNVEHKPSRLLL